MTKFNIAADCGNAPRKLFLSEFIAAMSNNDLEFIAKYVVDNITWENSGTGTVSDKETYLKSLEGSPIRNAKEINIESMITHGAEAAVSGRILDSQNKQFLFCDLYKFNSAGSSQIKHIRSFFVQV